MSPSRLFTLDGDGLLLRWEAAGGPVTCAHLTAYCHLANGRDHSSGSWRSLPPSRRGQARLRTRLGPLEVTLVLFGRGDGPLRLTLQVAAQRPVDVISIGLKTSVSIGAGPPAWVVYDGYQSWDPAGHRRADGRASESWWTCGLAGERGEGLAAAAASARRATTAFVTGGGGPDRFEIVHRAPPGPGGETSLWTAHRPGATWHGEPVVLASGPDVHAALAEVARSATAAPRPRGRAQRGWLSWYQYGPWVSPADVLHNARELVEGSFADLGFGVVQVDDGWQEAWGDWVPNSRFGPDLHDLAGALDRLGLTPGIWVAPFLAGEDSTLAHEAPESWFLHDPKTGARALDPRESPIRRFEVLDLRRSAVRDHMEATFARLRQAGFRYFKIDFVYAGAYSGLPALRSAVAAIRRGIGDGYLLACGAPLLPMAGLVDGCRIGPDTATPIFDTESGTPRPAFVGDETRAVARNIAARHFLGAWFELDPDVALVTGGGTEDEARQLVTAVVLSGGAFHAGDDLPSLPPERRCLLTNPAVLRLAGGPAAVPDWQPDERDRPPRVWRRPDGVIGVFNWEMRPARIEVDLRPAPGTRAGAFCELWTGEGMGRPGDRPRLELPPRGVGLIAPAPG